MSMISRDRALESLLDLSGRPVGRSRPELLSTALQYATQLVDAAAASIVVQRGRRTHRFTLRSGSTAAEPTEHPPDDAEASPTLLHRQRPLVLAEVGADERVAPGDRFPGLEAGPAMFVPLKLRDHESAYLAVCRSQGAPGFVAEEVRVVTLLAAWMAMALENLRLAESVERLAVTDDLTQVYNFRFLKTALRREIKRATRFHQDLALIMIDVDNLKGYNDRHGHLRGSFLLREMARVLAQQVRSWDLVAKYGGDEFTIILPQTMAEGALAAAERLRAAVEDHTFPLAGRGAITISLGVACYPVDGDVAAELLEVADRALYVAKQRGRNCVERPTRLAA